MAEMITTAVHRDIEDIGKAINTKGIITPRYGAPFKSLPLIAEESTAEIEDLKKTKANDADVYKKTEVFTKAETASFITPKADRSYVDTALSSFQNGAIKAYPTLAAANADIANIALNTKVSVLSATEGGDYYKATAGATSLTKSPYDPTFQLKLNNWEDINNALNNINPDYSTLAGSWDSTSLVNVGYLLEKNGVMAQTGSPTDRSSNFISIQAGQTVIVVSNVGALHAPICFYSTNSESSFVESIDGINPAAKPKLYSYTAKSNGYVRVFSSSSDYADAFTFFYAKVYSVVSKAAPTYEQYISTDEKVIQLDANLRYDVQPDDVFYDKSILDVWGALIDATGARLTTATYADRVSEYIFVKAGKTVSVTASVSSENSVIAFYSSQSEASFVTSVLGRDNTRDSEYTLTTTDGYIRLYSSEYANPNAFTKYKTSITSATAFVKIYATPQDIENIGTTKNTTNYTFSTDMAIPTANFGDSKGALRGIVLRPSTTTADFDSLEIESPYIIFDEKLQQYVMVYTAYGQGHISAIGWAVSDDLENWTKKGLLLSPSGIAGNGDQYGVTGPCIYYYLGTYYMYYLGLGGTGYEGEPINMCLATTTSLTNPVWTYHGIKIPIQTTAAWANLAIYHPNLFFYRDKWWMFFNARGNVGGVIAERFGYATSDSINGEWVVATERVSQNLEIDGTFILAGDPVVFDYEGLLYCFYFSALSGGTAVDQWAWTTPSEFPRGWRRGGYLLNTSPPQQSQYAHKPFVVKKGNTLYHYYTAVGNQGRVIALKTYPI